MANAAELERVPGSYAVCRLEPDAPAPAWAQSAAEFCSVTRTPDELSIVCAAEAVPEGVASERGWACLRVAGTLAFDQTGIAAALTAPLARAGVPILLIATHDTDYLLVREADLDHALAALAAAGHRTG
jgi:hypothetical protein